MSSMYLSTYAEPAASQVSQTIHLVTDDMMSEARGRLGRLAEVVDARDLRRWLALAIAGGAADPIASAGRDLTRIALGDASGLSGDQRAAALARRAGELRRDIDGGIATPEIRARLAVVESS